MFGAGLTLGSAVSAFNSAESDDFLMDADLNIALLRYRNGPTLDAALALAPGLFGAGRENDALEVAEDALARFGEHPALLSVAGHIWLARKELKHAQAFFQRALACDRKQAEVYAALAEVLVARGDATRARLALQKASALAPPDRALEAKLRKLQPRLSRAPFRPSDPSMAPQSQAQPAPPADAFEQEPPTRARESPKLPFPLPSTPRRKPLPVPPPSLRAGRVRSTPAEAEVPRRSGGRMVSDALTDAPRVSGDEAKAGAAALESVALESADAASQTAISAMFVDEAWLQGSQAPRSVEHAASVEPEPERAESAIVGASVRAIADQESSNLGHLPADSDKSDADESDDDGASTSLFLKDDLFGDAPNDLDAGFPQDPDTAVGEIRPIPPKDGATPGDESGHFDAIELELSTSDAPPAIVATASRRRISTSAPPPAVHVEAKGIETAAAPATAHLDLNLDIDDSGLSFPSGDPAAPLTLDSGMLQTVTRQPVSSDPEADSWADMEAKPQRESSRRWRGLVLGSVLALLLMALVVMLLPRALAWKLEGYASSVLREPARLSDPPLGVALPEGLLAHVPGLHVVHLEREALEVFEATSEADLRQSATRLASKMADIGLRNPVPEYFSALVEAQVHWAHGRGDQALALLGGRIPEAAALSQLLQARLRFEVANLAWEDSYAAERAGDLLALLGATSAWRTSASCRERALPSSASLAFTKPDGEWQSLLRLCWGKARAPQVQTFGFWAQVEAMRAAAAGEPALQAAMKLKTEWPSRPWAALAPLRWLNAADRSAFARNSAEFLGALPEPWRIAAVDTLLAAGDLEVSHALIEHMGPERAGPLAARLAWLSGGVSGAWREANPSVELADTFAALLMPPAKEDEEAAPPSVAARTAGSASTIDGDDRSAIWQRLVAFQAGAEPEQSCADLLGLLVSGAASAQSMPAFERSFWIAQLARGCGDSEVLHSAWRRTVELLPEAEVLPGLRLRLWAALDALLAGQLWGREVANPGTESSEAEGGDADLGMMRRWLKAVGTLGDPSAPDAATTAVLRELGTRKVRPLPWIGALASLPVLRVGVSERDAAALDSALSVPLLLRDQALALAVMTEALEGNASQVESWLRQRPKWLGTAAKEGAGPAAKTPDRPLDGGEVNPADAGDTGAPPAAGEAGEGDDVQGDVTRRRSLAQLGSLVAEGEINHRAGAHAKAIDLLTQLGDAPAGPTGTFITALGALVRGKAQLALARTEGIESAGGRVRLEDALVALKQSIEHPLMVPQAHFFLAEALVAAGEKGAREHFRRYLDLAPAGSYAERAQAALL